MKKEYPFPALNLIKLTPTIPMQMTQTSEMKVLTRMSQVKMKTIVNQNQRNEKMIHHNINIFCVCIFISILKKYIIKWCTR